MRRGPLRNEAREVTPTDGSNREREVESDQLVYLNGRFVAATEARLAIWDAGVVQGATIAEMTRTFRKQPFRLNDHLDRLFHALHLSHMDIGLSKAELADISRQLLIHNAQRMDERDEMGLVHFVTAGETPLYALGRPPRREPTVCVHTFVLPFAQWAARMKQGTHLIAPSIRQVPPQCWPTQMKCRSRMHYYLADREVQARDPDAMALLLDLAGNVTETSSGNFLMVERGILVSPPVEYTLPGISRATIVELAEELAIPFESRDIPLPAALAAEEAFLSSTSYCLMPVTRINGEVIGEGRPGAIYRRLLTAWSQRVGVNIERQIMEERLLLVSSQAR
jgi:branched-chain amino acid aminotransferase